MMESSSSSSPIIYDLVLVGCGHAHVHVLKMIGMMKTQSPHQQPTLQEMGIRITIISSHYHTPYSGMLPGYIAGHYIDRDMIHLNVIQLARFANVTFVQASVNRITYHPSKDSSVSTNVGGGGGGYIYTTDDRPPIRYDCLSIDIGSAPSSTIAIKHTTANTIPTATATATATANSLPPEHHHLKPPSTTPIPHHKEEQMVIPVKPIADLCQYWDTVVQQYQHYLNDVTTSTSTIHSNHDVSNYMATISPSSSSSSSPYTIAIIGGGAGGIELALSIQYRLTILTQRYHHQQQQQSSSTFTTPKLSDLLQIIIITRGKTILESSQSTNRRCIRKFQRILQERNIQLHCNAEVEAVIPISNTTSATNNHDINGVGHKNAMDRSQKQIIFKNTLPEPQSHPPTVVTTSILVDVCFSCITGTAASWLSDATPFTTTGRDGGNYLRVHPTYELIHHRGVFATGDCCHMDQSPRPKAGVFAVRAGPILFTNLLRYIFQHQKLLHHRPQSTYLSIISTGDQYAIACKGRYFCIEGRYVWHIKDYIDRKWMAKYSTDLPDLEVMMKQQQQQQRGINQWFGWPKLLKRNQFPSSKAHWAQQHNKSIDAVEAFQENPMRCGGCGSKVGATIVSRVLRMIYDRQVIRAQQLGCSTMPSPIDHDDAAITILSKSTTENSSRSDSNGAIIQTIDYFREMISDPYIFGKVVAVHALSDIHAMGTCAQSALVLAVVPFAADDSITESTLLHLLSGVSDVLQEENVSLVGGHTCEGIELACGLSIQGYTDDPTTLWRKRGGQVGDQIILTKPIGTGALFAAEMRAKASGDHVAEAIHGMLQSNYAVSCAAREFCSRQDNGGKDNVVHACTDVTGFGLIGHLLEMLLANEASAAVQSSNHGEITSIRAVLNLKNIPFYHGGIAASQHQIYSSLQKQNDRNRRAVYEHSTIASTFPIEYPLLFDPQTAGGLLFFVHPMYSRDFTLHLQKEGKCSHVSVIGEVEAYAPVVSNQSKVTAPSMISEACIIGNHAGSSSTENRIRIVAQ